VHRHGAHHLRQCTARAQHRRALLGAELVRPVVLRRFVYEIVSDSALRERNTAERFSERTSSPRVVLRRFVYEVVEDPDFGGLTTRPILELFGGTTDATVAIDPRLRTATATAAVPTTVCWSVDEAQCAALEGAVIDVAATWQGTGELQRIDERETFGDRTTRYRGYTQGWERSATARATLDGAPVPGALVPEFTGPRRARA
jgi:hypothetical protein